MNFDDLHDPHPPRPGPAALAHVAARARQLRRRRTALMTAGGLIAAAAIAVPAALVVTGDDGDSGRIVPATIPVTGAPPATAVQPSTTVAADETLPSVVPSTTSTPPTTATAVSPLLPRPVVAVLGNGDAVYIGSDGVATLLYDGADPRDEPLEGDLSVADSVIATPAGRMFVSTCCEPVSGTWFESGGAPDDVAFGHGLALSPDGQRIASVGPQGITVTDLDRNVLASADLSAVTPYRQPENVMWLDDDTLAIIEFRGSDVGNELRLYTVDATLTDVAAAEGVVIGTDIDATWPQFGGLADDGSILVHRGERGGDVSDRLEAYDVATLAPRPESDIVIEHDMAAVDAWYRDGLLTWVGIDDVLHVGDVELPTDGPPGIANEFAWARPAG